MRRPLLHTKVTVKLRKSIFREEWYLYIESYPVRNPGSTKPKRVIEAVNRTITTPIWDMTAISRTPFLRCCLMLFRLSAITEGLMIAYV